MTALVRLLDGRTYVATEARIEGGWVHLTGRRKQGKRPSGKFVECSFPRELVRDVRWGWTP